MYDNYESFSTEVDFSYLTNFLHLHVEKMSEFSSKSPRLLNWLDSSRDEVNGNARESDTSVNNLKGN